MKTKAKSLLSALLTLHSSLLILNSPAAVPLSWTVETSRAQPATFEAYQGETIDFEAALQAKGKPLEAPLNYSFFWQTNGMGNAYWEAPCPTNYQLPATNLLRATWLPAYDVGAKVYNCFIGSPSNIYHAAFQLRLRPSPGALPNALPLPQPVIDFAKVRVLNPPWSGGGGGGDTNAVIDIIHATVDGAARPLPKYLHERNFDDSYPSEAEEYYRSRGNGKTDGGCSAVRSGGYLSRNFDFPFDDRAEFVVRMSAGVQTLTANGQQLTAKRFASIGVAQVGTNLTEAIVTSGKPSRCYKWLPGATVDGSNEHGVVAEINVVDGTPPRRLGGDIHPLAAVRWALDNGTSAEMVATSLAARIQFPVGWTQNYHWMIADETSTYIVENGSAHLVTNVAVMTNFRLYPTRDTTGAGQERYDLLRGGANITNAWYTRAYSPTANWSSEFKSIEAQDAATNGWAHLGTVEARRATGLFWQSVHTSIYNISNRTLSVAVQEQDDWYTFAVPSAGGVKPEAVREIVQPMIDEAVADRVRFENLATEWVAGESYTNGQPVFVKVCLTAQKNIFICVKAHDGDDEVNFDNTEYWCPIQDYRFASQGDLAANYSRLSSSIDDVSQAASDAQQTADAAQRSASSASASVQQLAGQVGTIGAHLNDKADAEDVRRLNEGYQRLYAFSSGATNANISVTNYPPTAAEAEGRTHFDPSDPDLDFSTVPASMRLDETRDGVKRTVVDTRDFPVWWWFQKAPKLLASAKGYAEEKCAALFASLAAWADRTARGLENPAGESTLVIDVPNIWLMTDQTFEKHVSGSNSCWVIRSKNAAVSPNVATNGFLELTDAFGTPYIRFNKTEATFADPPASGIRYDDEAGEWLITYTTENKPKGGANLAIQGSADYPGKAILKEEGDELCPAVITWTGSKFNWIMHAKPKPIAGADPNRMFFAAVVEIEGQDYIEYLKPVSFSHIVVPNGRKIAPVVPASATVGSTVEWKVVQ